MTRTNRFIIGQQVPKRHETSIKVRSSEGLFNLGMKPSLPFSDFLVILLFNRHQKFDISLKKVLMTIFTLTLMDTEVHHLL